MTPDAPNPQPETPNAERFLSPGRFALVLAALLAVTFWRVLFGGEAFFYRDYGFLGYPFAHFHRECFWSGDFFPLWNPYVNCGAPFLAQWNTLCLYPGALIYLLLPLPWSLGFFCVAHLFLGGMGMRALAERWTGSRFGATVAGVAFVFSGLALGCVIYPNYLVALGWMPWVALTTRRAWQEGGRSLVLAALAGAMQMLSGAPEIILLTWGFLAALAVMDVGVRRKTESVSGGLLTHYVLRFTSVPLLITGLCAAQLLPFFQLLSLSQRSGDAVNTFWSLPGWGWVNLFFPLFMNFQTEQGVFVMIGQSFFPSVYLGIVPLTLALLAVWRIGLRRAGTAGRAESGRALGTAVPPHPGPLPPGEGERPSTSGHAAAPSAQERAASPPLPGGEGRGEGEGRELAMGVWNSVPHSPAPPTAVREVRLLAGATLLAVLLAMGDNFVLWRWLREVLPLGVVRFPVKALLLAAFTVPLLAAWGVMVLERSNQREPKALRSDLLTSFGLVAAAVALLWQVTLRHRSPTDHADALAFCAAARLGALALMAWLLVRMDLGRPAQFKGVVAVAAMAVMGADTGLHTPVFNPTIPAPAFEPGLATAYHASKGALTPVPKLGESRLMLSPLAERALHTRMVPKFYDDFIGQRLAFWGNLNLLDGLPKVNGASTLVTREWHDVEYFLYGTTNPAPANLMDFLGVTHTTKPGELMQWERRETAMPLVSAGLRPIIGDDSPKAPFAYVDMAAVSYRETVLLPSEARQFQLGTNRAEATARVRHFQPRAGGLQPPSAGNESHGRRLQVAGTDAGASSLIEIEAEAAAPTVVVIAQNFYPSWRATVNGQSAPVLRANHAFQAIPIPAGKSTIRLDYVDWPFRIGACISLATLLGCVVLWQRA